MNMKFHVIAGLPRSGSTLLSAILRQNPLIHAGVTSPVYGLIRGMQRAMADDEFVRCYDDERREALFRGIFHAYYARQFSDNPEVVVFDTNRAWSGALPLLAKLFPNLRLICCVRPIPWIVDSIERMLERNPLRTSRIFRAVQAGTVYERAAALMNEQNGLIGRPLQMLKEAWFGAFADRVVMIDYDRLTAAPQEVLQLLYSELGFPCFTHDLNHIVYDEAEYDEMLGMPGLHLVKPQVVVAKRDVCLPPDLIAQLEPLDFWCRGQNPRDVLLL